MMPNWWCANCAGRGSIPTGAGVDTEAAYLPSLRPDLDIILSDYGMPQFSGLRALELLKQQGLEIPFILVSGTIGEETAVAAMQQGAFGLLAQRPHHPAGTGGAPGVEGNPRA